MEIVNCDAIIFDLDGTLYEKKRIALYTLFKQLKNISMLKASNRIRKEFKGVDCNNLNGFYSNFFAKVGEELSLSSKEVERWYFNSFYPSFIGILKKRFKSQPGLIPLLENISKKLPLAVFSDYSYVDERLDVLNIDKNYFKIRSSSEEYGVLKPAARPLLDIASKLSVEPQNILIVGDRVDTDGKASEAAGMMFYHIDGANGWSKFMQDILEYIEERF